jgi:cysteine-rich repeat protein
VITLKGTVVGTGVTSNFMEPGHEEPTGIAFDPDTGRYFISDDSEKSVWVIDPGSDGTIGTPDDSVTAIDTTEFGSSDPEGVSFDTLRGHLYVCDGVNDEVYRIRPGPNRVFDGVPPDGDDVVFQFDTEILGIHDPEGIEHNADDDTLFISGSDYIAETTRGGTLLRLIDLNGLGVDKPAGLAYAPGSENAGFMHLYLAARGEDNDSDRKQNDGKIFELTLVDEPGVLDLRVGASRDDAEEAVLTGEVKLGGGDLELGFDDEDQQTVGIRFQGVEILRGTPILESYVQFTAEDESSISTHVTLRGQLAGNAPVFDSSDHDVSSRPKTRASVSWSPQPWNVQGAAGNAQRTPDLSPILQEIVNHPSWSVGNSLVLVIDGTGWRVAESYDGVRDAAPLLHVRFPPPNCGNGDREIGEQCDGSDFGNADCSDQGCNGGSLSCTSLCRFDTSTCTSCPVCGNGAVEFGEECDDENTVTEECSYQETACQVCDADCNLVPGATSFCGDGIVDASNGEECDDANLVDTDACTNSCRAAICGDGIVQAGVEECDDGNPSNTDGCLDSCAIAFCGDAFVRTGFEECDDGNLDNTDGCLDSCLAASCGDGSIQTGVEECDDANLDDGDACLTTCVAAGCGDGFTWAAVEGCDDANADNTDACLDTCEVASCGDGFLQAGVEQCDDANADNSDDCLDSCQAASCGDGFLRAGLEQCDDGNADETDACLTTCQVASCGDGYVLAGVEECDDGNPDNTDACLDTCTSASCGDGFVLAGTEECDDGNTDNTDGCLDICVVPEPSETLLLLSALAALGILTRRAPSRRESWGLRDPLHLLKR